MNDQIDGNAGAIGLCIIAGIIYLIMIIGIIKCILNYNRNTECVDYDICKQICMRSGNCPYGVSSSMD